MAIGGACGDSISYYTVLGVDLNSSDQEIRRAYRRLAMKWHPDKWAKRPKVMNEVKRKFQQIQEAYSVLSDRNKRIMYDAGLYNPYDNDEEVEGFSDFLQEMTSLVESARKERQGNNYTMEDLQKMFCDMAQSFDSSQCDSFPQGEQPRWDSFQQSQSFEASQWCSFQQEEQATWGSYQSFPQCYAV